MQQLPLVGKCAVVIGGTSGIGEALALGLAEAGAGVIATSRSQNATEADTKAIRERGRRTPVKTSDVASRASLEELRTTILAEFPVVDILVAAPA